jgi:adenylylsulfate kinase
LSIAPISACVYPSIAKYLNTQGKDVVVSLVSPYKDQRDNFKEKMGDDLKEIHIHTNEVRGREQFFVEDYQAPKENYLYICTDNITVNECAQKILN